uniref:Uncharacterized protein n=1 Tax=Cannabis sativa TaxID=3483 RepID=A0A803QC87_CANSA
MAADGNPMLLAGIGSIEKLGQELAKAIGKPRLDLGDDTELVELRPRDTVFNRIILRLNENTQGKISGRENWNDIFPQTNDLRSVDLPNSSGWYVLPLTYPPTSLTDRRGLVSLAGKEGLAGQGMLADQGLLVGQGVLPG